MPVFKSEEDLALLKRVDEAYRRGERQEVIARSEKLTSATGLVNKISRLGFTFTRDGGLRLVDTIFRRDLTDWLNTGDIAAAPEEGLVAA